MKQTVAMRGTSIREFYDKFPDDDACISHAFAVRYGADYPCPGCGRQTKWYRVRKRVRYANTCCGGRSLSPIAHTLMGASKISPQLWFYAMLLFANSRNGVATHFLQRHLGLSYKAAWRMGDRIRTHLALLEAPRQFGGPGQLVHVDETLIRGIRTSTAKGAGRAILFGIADAQAVGTFVVKNRRRTTLMPLIKAKIHPGSTIVTDSYSTYRHLSDYGWRHTTVNHSRGEWTNADGISQARIEQHWAALKRAIRGTHLHVERDFLWKYLKEYEFRANRRERSAQLFWDMIASFPPFAEDQIREVRRQMDRGWEGSPDAPPVAAAAQRQVWHAEPAPPPSPDCASHLEMSGPGI